MRSFTVSRTHSVSLLLLALLLFPVAAAFGEEEEEANVEFFYPLVTRRPVIERELEFKVRHEKGQEGRRTEAAPAIEWPILPRWQLELEIPVDAMDPREGKGMGGVGDLTLENKFLLFKSVEHAALVATGLK